MNNLRYYSFFSDKETENIKKFFNIYIILQNIEMKFKFIINGISGISGISGINRISRINGINKTRKKCFMCLLKYLIAKKYIYKTTDTIDVFTNKNIYGSIFKSSYPSFDSIVNKNSISNEIIKQLNVYLSEENNNMNNVNNMENMNFKLSLTENIKTNKITGINTVNPYIKLKNNNIRFINKQLFDYSELWKLSLISIRFGYSIDEILECKNNYEIECIYIGPKNISFENYIKSFSAIYILIYSIIR